MAVADDQNEDIEKSKMLIKEVAHKDGKLKSPIDIAMSALKPLYLDRLEWNNLESTPKAMKVINSGETVVVSAKWAMEVPYIVNGPLDGSYIFSQVHFHWGSHEDEGSEHTIEGVSYPMEMHVVFFKSEYLTQEVALKKDNGIVVIAYLIKVEEESTLNLQWLSTQLDRVLEPQSTTLLSPFPLSSLLVPLAQDYVLYWGSSASGVCSHTIQWLVSRAALSISPEGLNKFRSLLNFKKEPIAQNFQSPSPASGGTVFHVNPSMETEHFLLPGTFNSIDQSQELNEVFTSIKNPADHVHKMVGKPKIVIGSQLLESNYLIDDSKNGILASSLRKSSKEHFDEWNTSIESYSIKTSDSDSPMFFQLKNRAKEWNRLKKQCQSRRVRTVKLTNDKERRQELERNRLRMMKNEETLGKKMYKLRIRSADLNNKSPLVTAKIGQTCIKQQPIESGNDFQKSVAKAEIDENKNREVEGEHMSTEIYNEPDTVHAQYIIKCNDLVFHTKLNKNSYEKKEIIEKEKRFAKSKLPRPIYYNKHGTGIQSSYVKYFTKSPIENKKQLHQVENFSTLETDKNMKTANSSPRSNEEQIKRCKRTNFLRLQALSPRICNKPTDL